MGSKNEGSASRPALNTGLPLSSLPIDHTCSGSAPRLSGHAGAASRGTPEAKSNQTPGRPSLRAPSLPARRGGPSGLTVPAVSRALLLHARAPPLFAYAGWASSPPPLRRLPRKRAREQGCRTNLAPLQAPAPGSRRASPRCRGKAGETRAQPVRRPPPAFGGPPSAAAVFGAPSTPGLHARAPSTPGLALRPLGAGRLRSGAR